MSRNYDGEPEARSRGESDCQFYLLMALRSARDYFCTEVGVFTRFRVLGWQPWHFRLREEVACHCRWDEITLVEGSKKETGDILADYSYLLFIHAGSRLLKAQANWDGIDRFAALRDGLSHYLPGFPMDWQQRVDEHFVQTGHPDRERRVVLYCRSSMAEK